MDDEDTNELKRRLDCRNNLLDLIRKAYHRDILVIREFLLQLENGVKVSEIKVDDLDLRSLPSIDLRNEGFHLFSPQECELSLKPCFQCGGRLELTHHESSRFMALMESSKKLKEREKELDEKLDIALKILEEKNHALLKLECEALEEQKRLGDEIGGLTMQRDKLSSLCEEQQKEIHVLELIRQEKENLVDILARTNVELLESQNVNKQVVEENQVFKERNIGLQKRTEDVLRREESVNNRLLQMSNANQELKCNVSTLEELENQLMNELKACRSEMRRQDSDIRSTKDQVENLETKLTKIIDERNHTVETLDGKLMRGNILIKDLRAELSIEKNEAEKYRKETHLEMEMREKQKIERAANDQHRNDELNKRVDELNLLTLSHIRGLYDQCLEEENILHIEGALPGTKVTRIPPSDQRSTPIKYIEEQITKKKSSTHIEWGVVLEDEKERRKVFGNLNNRVLMNLGHIDSLIKRLHTKHAYELKRLKNNHAKEVRNTCATYDKRIANLEGRGKEREDMLNEVSTNCISTKKRLTTADSNIVTLKKEREDGLEATQGLKNTVANTSEALSKTRSDLDKTESDLESTKQLLHNTRLDLNDRDETLVQLEGLLQKTAERFSKRVEEDRIRLETNMNFGIQVKPATRNFQQQAHFVKSGSRSIRSDQKQLPLERLNFGTDEKGHYPTTP